MTIESGPTPTRTTGRYWDTKEKRQLGEEYRGMGMTVVFPPAVVSEYGENDFDPSTLMAQLIDARPDLIHDDEATGLPGIYGIDVDEYLNLVEENPLAFLGRESDEDGSDYEQAVFEARRDTNSY